MKNKSTINIVELRVLLHQLEGAHYSGHTVQFIKVLAAIRKLLSSELGR